MTRIGSFLVLAGLAAGPALAGIESIHGPVADTRGRLPYGSARVPASQGGIDLAAQGYVEEEWFIRGTATAPRADARPLPYTTRILVRRPADRARFSGVVHFEPMHPQFGTTSHWATTARYILRSGDAYVAASLGDDLNTRSVSQKQGIPVNQSQLVHWFDAERYAPLSWPEEDGIRFDVMAQIGSMLRAPARKHPLAGWPVKQVIVGGWSFTGSLQRSFINEGFHDTARLPGGKPVFDAYLIGISSRWNGGGYLPAHSGESAAPNDSPRRELRKIDVPVIEFLSETEVTGGNGPQRPDVDSRNGGHRLYELGGTVHSSNLADPDGLPERSQFGQLRGRGYPLERVRNDFDLGACEYRRSDIPHGAFAIATVDNLKRWVRDGIAPPKALPLQFDQKGQLQRDAAGNPLGGIRTAEFEMPLASFRAYEGKDKPECVPTQGRPQFLRLPLSQDELGARYRSEEDYVARYGAQVRKLQQARWLLAPEAEVLLRKARDDYRHALAPRAAPPIGFGQYHPAEAFPGIASSSFYLTMRDGVRLAVRVDRPARDGKPVEGRFPVLWHHSLSVSQEPGDGTGNPAQATRAMPRLVRQGYVVVQVARRGNGQSFGVRRGYHDRVEAHDGYEIMEWLATQSWSNGKLGVYGCSNTGDAGLHAVSMGHPALKAAFLGCFSWNKYDAMRRGGITAQWGTGPTRSIEEDMQVSPVDGDADKRLLRQAAEEHQLSTPLAQMWAQMPWRDSFSTLVASRFWSEGSASSYAPQIRRSGTALYIHGGWRDELRDQAFVTWLNVPGSRVTIGPWIHCNNEDFGLLEEALRFFDYHLKGIDNGFANGPSIVYRTVNAPADKAWHSAVRWPLPQQSMQTFRLVGTKLLADGAKTDSPAGARAVEAMPGLPCDAEGSIATVQPCPKPGQGIVYASAPLKTAVEVTGHPDVSLWVDVDGEDAHVFVYLQDVAPDGTIRPVTEGRLRATLRAEHEAPYALPAGVPWHRSHAADVLPVKAGEPVRLHFDMMPTSWLFQQGHRLQVVVAGADHREKNRPATLAPRFRVLSDVAHASTIQLPVIATD